MRGKASASPLQRWITTRGPLRVLVLLPSQFANRPALWCNGWEIAHAHDDGTLDVRLTRRETGARTSLPAGVSRRGSGDWIEIEPSVPERIVRELIVAATRAHETLESRAMPSPARITARQRLHRAPVTK